MSKRNRNNDRNFYGTSSGRTIANGPAETIRSTYNGERTISSMLESVVGKRPITVNEVIDRTHSRFGVWASYQTVRQTLLRHPDQFRLVETDNGISFRRA